MFQQVIAVIIMIFFLSRLFLHKKRKKISTNEFLFWLIFWIFSFLAIIFIKKIDSLVANLGFSASGIDVLLYFGFVVLFYLIFRLRLKIEKMDRNITTIVREITLINNKKNHES
ncbi:DUF2304 family protein [Candidatus Parcubacteria bacterium]|nr:DUF2304 family protein [Candidatus Parcubacteria bacterium]